MRIGTGENTYEWDDHWAKLPDTESARTGWAHHGVVVTEAGDIVTFHQADGMVLVLDKDGNLKRSWAAGVTEAHGMTLVKEGGAELLWIADNGSKRQPGFGYEYPPGANQKSGQVVKMTLDGQRLMRLPTPPLDVYKATRYAPTSVAVNEERHGGNGDVWVADGYGASYVHRFDKRGKHISSINGEEGKAGRFNTPHSVFIDRRKPEPELYIADRSNKRVQVYDLDGVFKRAFDAGLFRSPSAFAVYGDQLIIAELHARLAVMDINDKLVCYLGDNEAVIKVEGWPNNKNERGQVVATRLLEAGKFNSPHGMAVDSDGNIYVAEWLIGGRFVKLTRSKGAASGQARKPAATRARGTARK
jgi:DNA-binding beta-propeller fold protein YncE